MATKRRILKLSIIKLKESIFHSKEEGGLAKECSLEQGCHLVIFKAYKTAKFVLFKTFLEQKTASLFSLFSLIQCTPLIGIMVN
jgi:hypothetical protein